MLARSHVLLGLAGWSVVAVKSGYPLEAAPFGAAALGSLAPDLDHPGSWLGRRLWFISHPLSSLVGHRGVTHSLLGIAALGAALWLWGGVAGGLVAAFVVGYLSHLGADWLTHAGLPLLWPWQRDFSAPVTVQAGGAGETVWVALLLGGAAIVLAGLGPELVALAGEYTRPWIDRGVEGWRELLER